MKRKKLFFLLSMTMMLGLGNVTATFAEENMKVENENSVETEMSLDALNLKETATSDDEDVYYPELLANEKYNFKLLRNIPTIFDESWSNYLSIGNMLTGMEADSIDDKTKEQLDKIVERRKELVQVKPVEEAMWYLWSDTVPQVEETVEYMDSDYDNEDFKPFLVPYILEDQDSVKGNLILIAGGGYSSRNNTGEGYPMAQEFNERGYNCYVLQRRVAPYDTMDIWMDMQRAVRVVRNRISQDNLGGADCICAAGFSGGSATILGALANFYGDITPVSVIEGYEPDEIDQINSDLDVVISNYGPNYTMGTKYETEFKGLETENPNLPYMFFTVGINDPTGAVADNLKLIDSVADKTVVEYHAFANNAHGFARGMNGTNSTKWMDLADGFIDQFIAAKAKEK